MDFRHFTCTHCGARNACPESFALAHAGRRVTRSCALCGNLFDVELPPNTTLGHLLFGKPGPPCPSESDWRELVRAIAAGNAQALYTLHDRLHGIVFALMLANTRERETAEALTPEAFYELWQQARAYDPDEGSVIGWLLNKARSRAIRHLKLQRRSRQPMESSPSGGPLDCVPPTSRLWERLARRITAPISPEMAALPEPAVSPEWQDAGAGISYKVLGRHVEAARVSMLVRLAPGAAYPPHTHAGLEELYLLDGELWIDSTKVRPGEYNRAEAGTSDQRVWSETGCTCVLLTSSADILR